MTEPSIAALQTRIAAGIDARHRLMLACGGCTIQLNSNSAPLIKQLADYFRAFLTDIEARPDVRIEALQIPAPDLALEFLAWPRDPGKVGGKDSYRDLADGRALRKVKTGIQYLIGGGRLMMFGDCLKNSNQVVNFVNAQQIRWLMNRGWALCHAAAVSRNGQGLAISAFSGGGKSRTALHLINRGLYFVSNDRTLISLVDDQPMMRGVPKHPRINPGTILNNPMLSSILSKADAERLQALETDALWQLEEKYDAPIDQLYGLDRFRLDARMQGMLILNWSRTSPDPTRFRKIDIANRPDLLAAVMKAPGPFFIPDGADAPTGIVETDPADYLPVLRQIPVFEATGRIDFEIISSFFDDFIGC